jgi:hypothetical protein
VGEASQDYNLIFVLKKNGLLQKNVYKNKKIKNPNNNKGNEQIKKKKTTIRQCKPNNVGNEHNTSGLLQKNVYRN